MHVSLLVVYTRPALSVVDCHFRCDGVLVNKQTPRWYGILAVIAKISLFLFLSPTGSLASLDPCAWNTIR